MYGLIGTGAGLCARILANPRLILTNEIGNNSADVRVWVEPLPGEDVWLRGSVNVNGSFRFPYGYIVEPP